MTPYMGGINMCLACGRLSGMLALVTLEGKNLFVSFTARYVPALIAFNIGTLFNSQVGL